jgi:hypothetical protein
MTRPYECKEMLASRTRLEPVSPPAKRGESVIFHWNFAVHDLALSSGVTDRGLIRPKGLFATSTWTSRTSPGTNSSFRQVGL